MQERTKTICDSCGKTGEYQETGRGNVMILGEGTQYLLSLKDICQRCAEKANEAVREKLKIVG